MRHSTIVVVVIMIARVAMGVALQPPSGSFIIKDNQGQVVAYWDAAGNFYCSYYDSGRTPELTTKGLIVEQATAYELRQTSRAEFIVQGPGGHIVALLDPSYEYSANPYEIVRPTLYLQGRVFQSSDLEPPDGSFMVRDATGTTQAFITPAGDMYLAGEVGSNVTEIAADSGVQGRVGQLVENGELETHANAGLPCTMYNACPDGPIAVLPYSAAPDEDEIQFYTGVAMGMRFRGPAELASPRLLNSTSQAVGLKLEPATQHGGGYTVLEWQGVFSGSLVREIEPPCEGEGEGENCTVADECSYPLDCNVCIPPSMYGKFDNGGGWLYSVFRPFPATQPNYLLGFYHAEDHYWPDALQCVHCIHYGGQGLNRFYGSTARCVSTDNGLTWTRSDLGQIITSSHTKEDVMAAFCGPKNSGDSDAAVALDLTGQNPVWYCFFTDHDEWIDDPEMNPWHPAGILKVARSTDADAAPGTWYKLDDNGSFTVDALGGRGAKIPALVDFPNAGSPQIHFNTYLNRWVMVYHTYDCRDCLVTTCLDCYPPEAPEGSITLNCGHEYTCELNCAEVNERGCTNGQLEHSVYITTCTNLELQDWTPPQVLLAGWEDESTIECVVQNKRAGNLYWFPTVVGTTDAYLTTSQYAGHTAWLYFAYAPDKNTFVPREFRRKLIHFRKD